MGEHGTTGAANGAGLRLHAALTARRRADAAIRAAVHDLVPDTAANTEDASELLANTLTHTVPDLNPDDVALATVTALEVSAAAETSSSTTPTRPPMPPVVFLRGAGVDSHTFDRIHAALWARSLWTTTNRTAAMHLSRGGLPVWMVDFSVPQQPAAASTTQTGTGELVSISEVRAVYEPDGQQMQLKRISGHRVDRPVRAGALDVDALADLVAAETVITRTPR